MVEKSACSLAVERVARMDNSRAGRREFLMAGWKASKAHLTADYLVAMVSMMVALKVVQLVYFWAVVMVYLLVA